MRLGQLSRKVDIKPLEILSYLKNEFDVELGSHLNTKVDDALADKVIQKFSTKIEEPELVSEPQTNPVEVDDQIIEEVKEVIQPTIEAEPEKVKEFDIGSEINEQTRLNAEVIKAPKVELPGPTVIGKIELPPSLAEQMVEVDGVMMSKQEITDRKNEERKQKREKYQNSKKRTSGSIRSSIIKSEEQLDQLKRDKEAEALAKKIESREKRLSEKNKKETKPNAKQGFVKKPVKKRPLKKQEIAKKEIIQKPKPTTWYGKLWLWFNT